MSVLSHVRKLGQGPGKSVAGRYAGRAGTWMRSLAAAVALGASAAAPAGASLAWGSINNFDTVNDTGYECHGFEIEIDGIHSQDITYTYDWNHYGTPKITEDNADPLHPRVFVRYQSARNADGSWAAYTAIPSGPINPTDGHQFTNPSVNFGGEHFGVGYYGSPAIIKYSWLKDDGQGNLVFAGAVNIATPTFTYYPPAAGVQAEVQAEVHPPEPAEAQVLRFGPASWVREIRTVAHNSHKVELRDLVSDDPNDPNFKNWKNKEQDEVEIEWQLFQTDFSVAGGGKNGQLVGALEGLPNGDEVITRRYEFYQYVGPIDPETGEALADAVAADGIHGTGTKKSHGVVIDLSQYVVVGDYVGAQMAAFDAAAQMGLIDHLQDGEQGVAYPSRSLVIGGTAPIITTLAGDLPAGMSFDVVTGILSGTPTVSGAFTFTVRSRDAAGADVSMIYHLSIAQPGQQLPAHSVITTTADPIAGGTITGGGDYLNGTTITLVATPQPGYAFVHWTEGGAEVSVSPSYQFEVGQNRSLVATFVKAATPTLLTMPAVSTQIGKKTTLSAVLKDKLTKVVLAGQLIQFRLDGANVGAPVLTNSVGKATYTFIIPDGYALGSHPIGAQFAGAGSYSASTVANTMNVAKGAVKLTISNVSGLAGATVKLKAKITNSAGIALAGKSLTFSVNGTAIGTLVSDSTGTAILPYTIPAGTVAGIYVTGVSFGGDSNYLSGAKAGTLTVK